MSKIETICGTAIYESRSNPWGNWGQKTSHAEPLKRRRRLIHRLAQLVASQVPLVKFWYRRSKDDIELKMKILILTICFLFILVFEPALGQPSDCLRIKRIQKGTVLRDLLKLTTDPSYICLPHYFDDSFMSFHFYQGELQVLVLRGRQMGLMTDWEDFVALSARIPSAWTIHSQSTIFSPPVLMKLYLDQSSGQKNILEIGDDVFEIIDSEDGNEEESVTDPCGDLMRV